MADNKHKLELTWVGKNNPEFDISSIEPRILEENPELSNCTNDPNTENMIIHGDNLLALKALLPEYEGKIKCIYIDPPYNTGKAFDNYDDNVEHSLWLSLMKPRLELLRLLLSDDGFFCCHIDDSEGSYLKILLDEIFGRENYLTTFFIQVRYPNKTLAEDSDYQKVIEQCFIYSKNKNNSKINRPKTEYSIEKFKWKIAELGQGETITLGSKKVTIFKPDQYKIDTIEPSVVGLKETWATGSLSRVKASAGEFFELYLSGRKNQDGLGCLYKVYGIGEDGYGFRYISGPKKDTANKGKFYSGIPLDRLEEIKNGASFKYSPVSNFYEMAGAFGNCRLEGGVDFKAGKKPEILISTLLSYFSNLGDLVMDSFLGSGTTAAVAHKLNRKYIGIELGNQAYSHCKVRLDNVIEGDQSGISKLVNWKSGGAYKFYELAPSFITVDEYGNQVIDSYFNDTKLIRAMCKLLNFEFKPSQSEYWKHGIGQGNNYIYVTTQILSVGNVQQIKSYLKPNESLTICAKKFEPGCKDIDSKIIVKKIPQSILNSCEFGKKEYLLPIKEEIIDDTEDTELD